MAAEVASQQQATQASRAESKFASAVASLHKIREQKKEAQSTTKHVRMEQKKATIKLQRTEMILEMKRGRCDEDIRIAIINTKASSTIP